jgi:hypothetical protein
MAIRMIQRDAARPVVMDRKTIERRLIEIQAELDHIGTTFGMQDERARLSREKDELLDRLLALLATVR